MATAYQIRLAQAAGDLDEDKLKKLGIAQLNSQLSNANSATAQATAAAVKQATNPTAAQAGIKGAAGVGATVAGAIPMANTPNLPVNPNTPEQKYLANYTGSAGASGTTATAQPTQQKDYLFFGTQDPNFKLGMSAEDQASWNAIGQKYAAGDQSWNRDTNQFREDGNWSGYYDDSGNYNGWLRAVDGTGGYTPAFGGKVGETGYAAGTAFYAPDGTVYTLGADGSLAKSGNATTVKYGSYIGPKSGYQDSEFWALNSDGQYQRYTNQTAPDEVLEAQGYYRDQNGLVMPIGDEYYIAKGIQNGQITPEQAELAKLARTTNNDTAKTAQAMAAYTGNENAPKPVQTAPQTVQPSVINSGSASRSSTTLETTPTTVTPTVTPQQTQPAQTQYTPQQYTPPSENAYQQYLDQWDYEQAPEWTGGQDETYKEVNDYDYGQAPEWNENPPETWRDMQNYDYGQAPEYQGSPYDQQRDDALAAAGEKWNGSEYQQKRDDALSRAEQMRFNYDPNTDPNWQAYQKQYRREGDRAMQEAMAQAAMRTGGLANSYAVTAATQAGNYYASQLSDKLPQLYNDAYNRYLQEFQKQLGISDQYQGFDDREYSRWADQQGRNFDLADRYNQYGQQDYSKYQDTLDQFNRDRNFQYGVNRDAVSDELNNYNTRYNQYQDRLGQYNTDRNFQYGVNRDRVSDAERANETAYQRYLDSLDQYNRDRAMSYEQFRDAVGDARYADETAYDRAWNEDERSYSRAWNEENRDYTRSYQAQRDAVNDQRYDQQWAQQLREYADSQNWKAKDWEQYLREYEDKLSNQEREWAYQQYRDAVSDQRYNQQYADEMARYDREYAAEQDQNDWERGYKQTAYNDEMERSALNYLNTNGIVTGRYAEILGVPDGTTYEQYYSRYLGGSGSTSPFEVAEVPSGTTPKYTPPPGGGDEGDGNEPPKDPVFQQIRSKYGEDTAMEVWSLAGQPWYSDLKTLAGRDSAAALDQIYSRYEAGEISEYALEPLLDMLGLNMSSVTYKPSYRVTTVKGNRNGGSKGNNIQDIDNVRGR